MNCNFWFLFRYILLGEFVSWHTEYKATHGMSNIKLASRCLRRIMSMNNDQALDKELKENMPAVRELWKRRWGFVIPDFSTWFLEGFFKNSCMTTGTVGCWKWWTKRPAYLSNGSALSLNCPLFLGFSFSVNVPKCGYVVFLGKYRLCANNLLIFYITLWDNLFRLTSPVSQPPTR